MSDEFPTLEASVREITAEGLKKRLDGGERVTILDTRRPADFEAWTIDHPNATNVNVPFTEFLDGDDPADRVPEGVPDGPLVTCCAKGISSLYVATFLAREGYEVEALEDGMRGWARLYEYREIDADADATIAQYHRPSSGCLAYLVVSGDEAAVVDPLRAFADEYARDARALGAELTYAIDTHVHADHVSGVREVAARTGAEVVLPAGAEGRGLAFDATLLEDGNGLAVGDATIEAVHVPGHTTEMTGYRVGNVFVSGDSVFTDSVARPDLEDADAAADAAGRLHGTLRAIAAGLPDDTIVAPGHASPGAETAGDGTYTARLDVLRERLAAFSMDRGAFVEYVLEDLPPRPENYEEIIATNLGRRTVADDEAFELELGPNNCAVGTP